MTNKPNKLDDFPTEEGKNRFKEKVKQEKMKIIHTLAKIFNEK